MKPILLTVLALAAIPAAASAQRRVRDLPAPTGVMIAGDTAHIGMAVTGVDPNVRYLNITVRTRAHLEIYAMDHSGLMHQMASCQLDSGATTIRPTLTERIDNSARFQAGASFGNRNSASRGPAMQVSGWRYASSQEKLLIVVADEEPSNKQSCDGSGTGTLAQFGTMVPSEALNSLPPSLIRYPESHWAAFLVQP